MTSPRGAYHNDKYVMINPPGLVITGGLMKTLHRIYYRPQRSYGKTMFLHLLPAWADTPWADTPLGQTPLGRHPPSRYPLGRHLLLTWADTPWADTPRQTPCQRRPLQRTIRILLECILVQSKICI